MGRFQDGNACLVGRLNNHFLILDFTQGEKPVLQSARGHLYNITPQSRHPKGSNGRENIIEQVQKRGLGTP